MEFRELKTFQCVATLLSFNRAADILNYAQSTVSAQIRSLENDLGSRLFERKRKSIRLTPDGETLLQYTERLVSIEEEIKSKLKEVKNLQGSLFIKIPQTVSTYLLPSIVHDYQLMFPRMSIHFDWCTYYSLKEAFYAGITDLAFLIINQFHDPQLNHEIVMPIKLLFVTSLRNPIVDKDSIRPEDLSEQNILFPTSDCSYPLLVKEMLTVSKVKPRSVYAFNSVEAIKQCLIADTGVAVIPEIAVRNEVEEGSLVNLTWNGPEIRAQLFLIWKKEKEISKALEAFMILVRNVFRKDT